LSFFVFSVRLSSLFAYTSTKNQLLALQDGLLDNVSEGFFFYPFSDKFNRTKPQAKDEESRRKRFAIPGCITFGEQASFVVKF